MLIIIIIFEKLNIINYLFFVTLLLLLFNKLNEDQFVDNVE